jgi:TRAP-type C4-dicarboxylate transport system permease small subunit
MIRSTIDRLLDFLLWVILAAMALIVSSNVFCRFLLGFSIYWGDEVAQVLLAWLTFLGAAVAVRDDDHYYLNYISRQAGGTTAHLLKLFRHVVAILAIGVLLYYSAIVTYRIENWIMPATEVSRALVYGACPAGCAFMLYYALGQLLHDLRIQSVQPRK